MGTKDKHKIIFSQNLNYYMNLRGKTQVDIIENLGINKSSISSWCNGTRLPRMNKIELLANYLNISISDLIGKKHEDNNYFEYIATDNAMYPILDIGDIAVIYKQTHITPPQENSTNCGTYLLKINGSTTIRDVFVSSDKQIYTLRGRNVFCEPIDINKEDFNKKITILGKVVEAKLSSAFK